MIEFKALIHKNTGKVILYEQWKELLENNKPIQWQKDYEVGQWMYDPKTVLLCEDFEIIYESEIDLEALKIIYESLDKLINEYFYENCDVYSLKEMVSNYMETKVSLKDKYGIDM